MKRKRNCRNTGVAFAEWLDTARDYLDDGWNAHDSAALALDQLEPLVRTALRSAWSRT